MFASLRSNAPVRAGLRLFFALLIACVPAAGAFAITFTVNDVTDAVDEAPGDGICRTSPDNTNCTLRAAVIESNARAGADTIILQANTTYVLTRVGFDDTSVNGDLDVTDSLTIIGAGPASTTVDGNGVATNDRILQTFRCIGNATINNECVDGSVIVNISGMTLRGGRTSASGGGVSNFSNLTLGNVAIVENFTRTHGGGVASGVVLNLNASIVANNSSDGSQAFPGTQSRGNGVSASGQVAINDSTIRDNLSPAGSSIFGGGIALVGATAFISDSTISGNLAEGGGGIESFDSTIRIVNSTISGNSATHSGGGLRVLDGTVDLYNVTIAGNLANSDDVGSGVGGGVVVASADLDLSNSILTANIVFNEGTFFDTLSDCFGPVVSSGFNIVSNPGPNCTIDGAYLPANPLLGPLQNNGGPTKTHALQSGSAAIDAGNPAGCGDGVAILTTDQRGEARPFGAACDLGAFEFGDLVFRDGFEQ